MSLSGFRRAMGPRNLGVSRQDLQLIGVAIYPPVGPLVGA